MVLSSQIGPPGYMTLMHVLGIDIVDRESESTIAAVA